MALAQSLPKSADDAQHHDHDDHPEDGGDDATQESREGWENQAQQYQDEQQMHSVTPSQSAFKLLGARLPVDGKLSIERFQNGFLLVGWDERILGIIFTRFHGSHFGEQLPFTPAPHHAGSDFSIAFRGNGHRLCSIFGHPTIS